MGNSLTEDVFTVFSFVWR